MPLFGMISPFNKQKTAIFITVFCEEAYSLLRNLMAPIKPHSKSCPELAKILSEHLNPKPIVIAERFKFYGRNQQSGESVSEFLAELRKLKDK